MKLIDSTINIFWITLIFPKGTIKVANLFFEEVKESPVYKNVNESDYILLPKHIKIDKLIPINNQ